jgi:hypothetical protein
MSYRDISQKRKKHLSEFLTIFYGFSVLRSQKKCPWLIKHLTEKFFCPGTPQNDW